MDSGTFRGLLTLALLLIFIGIWLWAWSGKRKKSFEEAAQLPLEDASPYTPNGDPENASNEKPRSEQQHKEAGHHE